MQTRTKRHAASLEGAAYGDRLNRNSAARVRLRGYLPTYSLDYSARRFVEPKKDIKKRLGKSPDAAEAVMLAFAQVFTDEFKVESPRVQREGRRLGF